jgi:hypothetical protein
MEQLTPDERIAAQEKALDATHCELALLRQHMDARFTGVDDGLTKLKLETQLYVQEEIGKAVAQLSIKIDAVKAQSDRNYRWSIGLQFSILAAVLAVLARGLV